MFTSFEFNSRSCQFHRGQTCLLIPFHCIFHAPEGQGLWDVTEWRLFGVSKCEQLSVCICELTQVKGSKGFFSYPISPVVLSLRIWQMLGHVWVPSNHTKATEPFVSWPIHALWTRRSLAEFVQPAFSTWLPMCLQVCRYIEKARHEKYYGNLEQNIHGEFTDCLVIRIQREIQNLMHTMPPLTVMSWQRKGSSGVE